MRCFDWLLRRSDSIFVSNPLRLLSKRYATYTRADEAVLLTTVEEDKDVIVPTDISRDRRLSSDEEAAVRRILDGEKPAGCQRPLELKWQGTLELLFDLALETAVLPVTRYIICM
ncbi:hypothetical protein QU481_03705 [Crenobacter sp. SG2303]|uniref:Uncharacterized protein n=1 Tax=Crenobacter oryzisoli TaxID=3056844 RepID=A0ABT7XJN0_9NEIS|nr:hypothetical protein [Crenobacter sp. SG2303]MDN0073994.1 hypothetical protein [Crenobacter sp. SG2303]